MLQNNHDESQTMAAVEGVLASRRRTGVEEPGAPLVDLYAQHLRSAVGTGTAGGEGRCPSDFAYVDFAGVVWISESDRRERWHALSDQGVRVVASHDHLPVEFGPYFRVFSRDLVELLRTRYLAEPRS